MDERWKLTEVRGWGPDYTEIDVLCPTRSCPWEYTWGTETPVYLGAIVHEVQQHMESEHDGE